MLDDQASDGGAEDGRQSEHRRHHRDLREIRTLCASERPQHVKADEKRNAIPRKAVFQEGRPGAPSPISSCPDKPTE